MKNQHDRNRLLARHGGNRGYSLVEVLIALVVLSVGLLGLAGLQTSSLRAGNDAYLRTQANMLAYSIIDRMRSNEAGVTADDYQMAETTATQDDCPAATATFSTAADLAGVDKKQWLCKLADKLPGASGEIDTTPSGDHTAVTITIQWFEKRVQTGVDSGNTTLAVTTLL